VVIKVLSHELVQDLYARQKFEQEVEALVRVKHVVHVRDSGTLADGKPYFVMDYVEGATLKSQIESDAVDLKRAASILRQLGAVLTQVHQKGIVHRDLKPANVMLTNGDDSVVLLDFGIARVQDSVVASDTVTDVSPGTPPYMSPEQLSHETITPASDVYSMGVVAYEMIFGEKPFDPDAAQGLLALQRKGIGKLPPKISITAQHILRRALSFNSQNRYSSAQEFGDQLAAALLTPSVLPRIDLWPVAKVFGALLILAVLSLGIYKYWRKDTGPNNSFNYWLNIQNVSAGKEYKSNGEEVFNNGDKFQLNVQTPVPAFIYIFYEGPSNDTNFRMLYPNPATNGGNASVGANQTVQCGWMTFQGPPGDENFSLVWSLNAVPQLETAKTEAFNDPRGGLTNQNLLAVKKFLRSQSHVSVWHYKADQRATPRGKGDILVVLAQFKHR
jgi:serine/threonine protein kinase